MTYTANQIANAKSNYEAMMNFRSVESFEPQYVGYNVASQRCEFHNRTVTLILDGDKDLEKEWKLFFLMNEVKIEQKRNESKSKLAANKLASTDILAPIKSAKRIVEFGKWLNTSGNVFRKEHFSKKYSQASVNAFMAL